MATLDKELFDFVITQSGLVENQTIFRGMYPSEGPDKTCCLIWRAGEKQAPDRLARPRVQFLCRGATQDEALDLYQKVSAVLGGLWGQALPSQEIIACTEESAGFIGKDDRGRVEYSANYRLATDRVL